MLNNMEGIFANAISFNQAIGNWDLRSVKRIDGFEGAESFNPKHLRRMGQPARSKSAACAACAGAAACAACAACAGGAGGGAGGNNKKYKNAKK
jgi:hypothetical protein